MDEINESEIKDLVDQRVETLYPEIIPDASDRDSLVSAVRNDYKAIVQALIDSAKGMWVEKAVETSKGIVTRRVYPKEPNTDVAQYLLNQLIGKPKETQVMEGRVIFQRDI